VRKVVAADRNVAANTTGTKKKKWEGFGYRRNEIGKNRGTEKQPSTLKCAEKQILRGEGGDEGVTLTERDEGRRQ